MSIEDYFWWVKREDLNPLTIKAIRVQQDLSCGYSFSVTDCKGVQLTECMNLQIEKFEDRAYEVIRDLKDKGYIFSAVDVLGLHESELETRVKQRQEEKRQRREAEKRKGEGDKSKK